MGTCAMGTCAAKFLTTRAITPPCAIEFRELIDLYQPKHSAASIESAGFWPGPRCDRLAERFSGGHPNRSVFFRMGYGASDRSSLPGVIHEFVPDDFGPRVLATFR